MTYKEACKLSLGQKVRIKNAESVLHEIKDIHTLPKMVEILLDDGKWYIHRQLGYVPEIIACFDFQDFISNISGPVEIVWLNDKT